MIKWEDNETTFLELQTRITGTIDFLEALKPEIMDGLEEKQIEMKTEGRVITGRVLVEEYALPNFFFHIVIVYALLRMEGVPLGKLNYLKG